MKRFFVFVCVFCMLLTVFFGCSKPDETTVSSRPPEGQVSMPTEAGRVDTEKDLPSTDTEPSDVAEAAEFVWNTRDMDVVSAVELPGMENVEVGKHTVFRMSSPYKMDSDAWVAGLLALPQYAGYDTTTYYSEGLSVDTVSGYYDKELYMDTKTSKSVELVPPSYGEPYVDVSGSCVHAFYDGTNYMSVRFGYMPVADETLQEQCYAGLSCVFGEKLAEFLVYATDPEAASKEWLDEGAMSMRYKFEDINGEEANYELVRSFSRLDDSPTVNITFSVSLNRDYSYDNDGLCLGEFSPKIMSSKYCPDKAFAGRLGVWEDLFDFCDGYEKLFSADHVDSQRARVWHYSYSEQTLADSSVIYDVNFSCGKALGDSKGQYTKDSSLYAHAFFDYRIKDDANGNFQELEKFSLLGEPSGVFDNDWNPTEAEQKSAYEQLLALCKQQLIVILGDEFTDADNVSLSDFEWDSYNGREGYYHFADRDIVVFGQEIKGMSMLLHLDWDGAYGMWVGSYDIMD